MDIIQKALEFYKSHSTNMVFKYNELLIVPIHLDTCQFIIINRENDTFRYLSQSEIKYELRKQQQMSFIRSSLKQSILDNIEECSEVSDGDGFEEVIDGFTDKKDNEDSDVDSHSSFESFVSDSFIVES